MMSTKASASRQASSQRLKLKTALRGISLNLSLLNQTIGSRIGLRTVDLDCLDLLAQRGPLSPSALAQATGIHAATLTGVLDRLEKGGWVVRARASEDRRAVTVSIVPDKLPDLLTFYAGMNRLVDQLCSGYDLKDLTLIAEFMSRLGEASERAKKDLEAAPPAHDAAPARGENDGKSLVDDGSSL